MKVRISGDLLHAFIVELDFPGAKSLQECMDKVERGEITVESEDSNPGVRVDWGVEIDEDGNEIE